MIELNVERTTYITFPNNPEVDISNLSIKEKSLSVDEILCDGPIQFGESNATKFEVEVFNLTDVTGKKIYVYQKDAQDNITPIFTGWVDSCKQDDYGHYRTIVAYDAMYSLGSVNIAGWWYGFWENRPSYIASLKELRESLLEWAQIEYDTTAVLFNDNFECPKTAALTNTSFRSMMRWMCEISCVFPHMSRAGVLEFISLKPDNVTPVDIKGTYRSKSSQFEGYSTSPIDKVQIFDYNNDIVGTSDSDESTESTNVYNISNNILLYNLSKEEAHTFAVNYLEEIRNISYIPCTVDMIISNWSLELGTYIVAEKGTSIVLQNSYSGTVLINQSISAKGDKTLSETNSNLGDEFIAIIKKTEELKDDILAEALICYTYMNKDSIVIDSTATMPTSIINIDVTTNQIADIIFMATLNLSSQSTVTEQVTEQVTMNGTAYTLVRNVKKPVKLKCSYFWNQGDLQYYPTEQFTTDGEHFVTLCFFIKDVPKDTTGTFEVKIAVENGNITFSPQQIRANIFGAGLVSSQGRWDGKIICEEYLDIMAVSNFGSISAGRLTDSVQAIAKQPDTSNVTDTIPNFVVSKLPSVSVSSLSELITTQEVRKSDTMDVEYASEYVFNNTYVTTDNNTFEMRTEYRYSSELVPVDKGLLSAVEVPLGDFDTVTKLEVQE